MSKVLIIGDTHCPAEHPMYLPFCQDIGNAWDCDKIVHIGDVVDWHSISFHQKDPDMPGALDEYNIALAAVQKWYKAFPTATVLRGNHDDRIERLAASVNIPDMFLRTLNETWKTLWKWVPDVWIDDVYYFHGAGMGGLYPAFNKARSFGHSVVAGHAHSVAGINYTASPRHRFFGLNVGCGIDVKAKQFRYGANLVRRPMLACGVVIDGHPHLETMPCGPKDAYHRSKA